MAETVFFRLTSCITEMIRPPLGVSQEMGELSLDTTDQWDAQNASDIRKDLREMDGRCVECGNYFNETFLLSSEIPV